MKTHASTFLLAAMVTLSPAAWADTYQVTFGWTAPTWIPSDVPAYGAKYRVNGGAPTTLADSATPGGSFSFVAAPGDVLQMCPQNKNKVNPADPLVTPDCSQPAHWITVGGAPYPPTVPTAPASFSATVIRTGP